MKLSRTALKELKSRYLDVLKKCITLNAMVVSSMVFLSSPSLAANTFDFDFSSDNLNSEGWQVVRYVIPSSDTSSGLVPEISTITTPADEGGKFYNGKRKNDPVVSFDTGDSSGNLIFSLYEAGNGGAIFNKGNLTFSNAIKVSFSDNKATNGGALYNENSFQQSSSASNNNVMTFNNNTATGNGGAIYNNYYMHFLNASFSNNTANGNGGAIYSVIKDMHSTNTPNITFYNSIDFSSNKATNGGAIYNQNGTVVTLFGPISFSNNTATENGGAIYSDGSTSTLVIVADKFESNSAKNGGALYLNGGEAYLYASNTGSINFNNNTATENGGALYLNNAKLSLVGGFTFSGNKTGSSSDTPNDIYMMGNTVLNFGSDVSSIDDTEPDEMMTNGGITGTGTINKLTAGSLYFSSKEYFDLDDTNDASVTHSDNSGYTGVFNQYNGKIYANSDLFFKGDKDAYDYPLNKIYGGELITKGKTLGYLVLLTSNDSTAGKLTHTAVQNQNGTYEKVNLYDSLEMVRDGNTTQNLSATFINGHYCFSNTFSYPLLIEGTTALDSINFQNATVDLDAKTYTDTYDLKYTFDENSVVDLRNNSIGETKFEFSMGGQGATLAFDVKITGSGEGDIQSDVFNDVSYSSYQFDLDAEYINMVSFVDNGTNTTYRVKVLDGNSSFNDITGPQLVATNVYQYQVGLDTNKQTILLSAVKAADENSLAVINQYVGDSAFNLSLAQSDTTYQMGGNLGATGTGKKHIFGSVASNGSPNKTILAKDTNGNSLSMFNLTADDKTTNLLVENVAISDALSVLDSSASTGDDTVQFNNVHILNSSATDTIINNGGETTLTLNKVKVDSGIIKNTSSKTTTITDSTLDTVENAGTLTATGGSMDEFNNQSVAVAEINNLNITTSLTNTGKIDVKGTSSIQSFTNNQNGNASILNKASVSEFQNNLGALLTVTGDSESNMATIDSLNNSGSASLNKYAQVSLAENTGTLTLNQDSKVLSLTNKNTTILNEKSMVGTFNNNDENATLTVNQNATITTLKNLKGKANLYENAIVNTAINEGDLIATKAKITSLTNKTGANATLDLVDGLTSIDNNGTLKLKQMTLAEFVQFSNNVEGRVEFSQENEINSILKNDGHIVALADSTLKLTKNVTGTGSLQGDNATLILPDEFSTTNNLISNNITFSDNLKKLTVNNFTIAENSQLNIKNIEVGANVLTLQTGSTLHVDLNNLSDFGFISGQKIVAENGAQIDFNLGDDFEAGIYHIFQMAEIVSVPTPIQNDVGYYEVNLENGKYSFISSDSANTKEEFSANDDETKVIESLHKGNGDNPAFNDMQKEVLSALQSDDIAKRNQALDSLYGIGGNLSPIIQSVATEHFQSILSALNMESSSLRVGRSAGENESRATLIAKGLYSKTKDVDRGNYKIHSTGGILSFQTKATDTLSLGAGYAYSYADAKQNGRDTNVHNNTGFAYVKYQPNNFSLKALFGYTRAQYEEEKTILSTRGKATYNVDSYVTTLMSGYDIHQKNITLTPKAGLRYMSLHQESYTDTLGTHTDNNTYNYLTLLAGLEMNAPFKTIKGLAIRPRAEVMFGYDVISDDMLSVNTLSNKATYILKGDALPQFSTLLNAGVEAKLTNNMSLSLEYNGSLRRSYQDHGGMIKFKYDF